MNINKTKLFLSLFFVLIVFFVLSFVNPNAPKKAFAASFSSLSDQLSRIKQNEYSAHTISFTTTRDLLVNDTVSIDFHEDDGSFAVDGLSSVADIDYIIAGQQATIVGIDGDCTGHNIEERPVAVSLNNTTGVLTLKNCSTWIYGGGAFENSLIKNVYAANRTMVIKIGSSAVYGGDGGDLIINPSIGTYNIDISGSWGDTGKIGVTIIGEDQISVSAFTDPTLTFSISDVSLGFGSFVSTAVRYATNDSAGSLVVPPAGAPTVLTAGTNGAMGLIIAISDLGNGSGGLYSPPPISELIPPASSSSIVNGSKTYGVYGKNSSGLTIDPGFDNDGALDLAISNNMQSFATSSGPINGSVDLVPLASISASTKAGNYSDTITIICTGRY